MDIDNTGQEMSGGGGGGAPLDVESALLQQFSCMGTTDKDELVKELQRVLGTHMNYNTAAFFLDMNNWNLQAAICSYFDFENPNKLPSMILAPNPAASENDNIEPSTSFEKYWQICNNGMDAWPAGCYVQCANGNEFSVERQLVPPLGPGQSFALRLCLRSPETPAVYQVKFRLCTPHGSYFGDVMWAIITVVNQNTQELVAQLSHLRDLGVPLNGSVVPPNPFSTHIQSNPSSGSDSNNAC